MKRSMAAACALGFGLLASAGGAQIANAMPKPPEGAAAAAQNRSVIQVWGRGGHHGGWGGGWRGGWRGHRHGYWRPGYGWVPFAVAGAVVAGVAADRYYYGPGPYYYGPPPGYCGYGPRCAPPPPPPGYYGPGYGPLK